VIEMLTVRETMTTHVVTVRPETPLKEVARVLIDAGISGVPVVNEAGVVLGVVSEADFVLKGQGATAIRHRRLAWLLGESATSQEQLAKVAATTAREAMTAPAVTIPPTSTLQAAAARMADRRVNRLPVVEDGRLIGIITRADLVRAYLRSDTELLATIRDDVLLKAMWLDPSGFEIDVQRGEASIRGHVERRSMVPILEEAIAAVPGIVSVTVDLTWALDDRALEPASVDAVFPHGIV
jgi:CBS domain-containing protein